VTGSTYAPEGSVYTSETERLEYPADNHALLQLAACACLCNDAQLLYSSEQGSFQKIGESTEAALLVLGEKLGLPATSPPSPSRHSLSKHEHASYCRRHWESRLPKVREEGYSFARCSLGMLMRILWRHLLRAGYDTGIHAGQEADERALQRWKRRESHICERGSRESPPAMHSRAL